MRDRIPPNVSLVDQLSTPDFEKLTWEVDAPTRRAAEQLARVSTRIVRPTARNLLHPRQVGSTDTEQSTIREFFPERWHKRTWRIEVLVV